MYLKESNILTLGCVSLCCLWADAASRKGLKERFSFLAFMNPNYRHVKHKHGHEGKDCMEMSAHTVSCELCVLL